MSRHSRYYAHELGAQPRSCGLLRMPSAELILGADLYLLMEVHTQGVPVAKWADFMRLEMARLCPFDDGVGGYWRVGGKSWAAVWSRRVIEPLLASAQTQAASASVARWQVWPVALGNVSGSSAPHVMRALQDQRIWPIGGQGSGLEPVLRPVAVGLKLPWSGDIPWTAWQQQAEAEGSARGQSSGKGLAQWGASLALYGGLLGVLMATAFTTSVLLEEKTLTEKSQALQTEFDAFKTRLASNSSLATQATTTVGVSEAKPSLEQVSRSMSGIDWLAFNAQLAQVLPNAGFIVRTFMLNGDEATLTLVSASGGDLAMDEAVAAMESLRGISNLQLAELPDAKVARFQFKLSDALRKNATQAMASSMVQKAQK